AVDRKFIRGFSTPEVSLAGIRSTALSVICENNKRRASGLFLSLIQAFVHTKAAPGDLLTTRPPFPPLIFWDYRLNLPLVSTDK
ncbi:MAG: hypothetical protein PVF97_09595, partial [Desulfobacterales bacterium]